MRRAEEKRKLKEAERKQLGEAAIKVENFRRSNAAGYNLSGSGQPKKEEAANPEQLEAQREMEGALMAAEQVRNTVRERLAEKMKAQIPDRSHKANISNGNSNAVSSSVEIVPKNPYVIRNPYASSRPPSSASTGTSEARAADPPTSAPTATGRSSASLTVGAQPSGSTRHVSKRARAMANQKKEATRDTTAAEHDNPEAMDALDQCLKQVKTDVFSGDRKSKPLLKFKQSNVPDGLECRICHDAMKDPLVSDCNHSACTSCWTQWLEKNSSCPVCRAAMTRKNLSRIVFREDDDADVGKGSRSDPTLSQVVREAVVGSDEDDSDGDSDDGEDELELVAG